YDPRGRGNRGETGRRDRLFLELAGGVPGEVVEVGAVNPVPGVGQVDPAGGIVIEELRIDRSEVGAVAVRSLARDLAESIVSSDLSGDLNGAAERFGADDLSLPTELVIDIERHQRIGAIGRLVLLEEVTDRIVGIVLNDIAAGDLLIGLERMTVQVPQVNRGAVLVCVSGAPIAPRGRRTASRECAQPSGHARLDGGVPVDVAQQDRERGDEVRARIALHARWTYGGDDSAEH